MNIILAVRENVKAAIDEKVAEIAKAEALLIGLRDELHILEDLRAAARLPEPTLVLTTNEEPRQVAA